MPIPDHQTFMRPLLHLLADGESRKMQEVYRALATGFQLSEEEMAELLPSGRQATYMNRIGWAKTYLMNAAALESPQRGWVKINERGRQLLRDHPEAINTRTLMTFPEFQNFQAPPCGTEPRGTPSTLSEEAPLLSPEEELAALYGRLNEALTNELLTQVQQLTPGQFERLVVEVLVAMGYGGSVRDAGQALGRSGDNGIDGMIKQDPLGLDRVYLQAKRWSSPVHSPEIRTFAGSLTFHRASKGVFLTTSSFSEGAQQTAAQIGNIILIDGSQLARLMIEYGVGVITRETYRIRRVDSEFFEEL